MFSVLGFIIDQYVPLTVNDWSNARPVKTADQSKLSPSGPAGYFISKKHSDVWDVDKFYTGRVSNAMAIYTILT